MTELGERLHIIRAHLRTGALGQREVWEEWLTEAEAEIERLLGVCKDKTVLLKEVYADNERLRAALQSLLTDPPATLDEPDTDAEVIIKMREIARRALEPKPHDPDEDLPTAEDVRGIMREPKP